MNGKIMPLLKPYVGLIVVTVIFTALQSMSDLWLPDLNASIINDGVLQGDISTILYYGAIMLVAAVLVGVCTLGNTFFSTKSTQSFARDLRKAMFERVQSFSKQDIDKFGTPSLITRTTNDVNMLQQMMQMVLHTMITTPILFIGGIVMCLKQDVKLSVILVFVIPMIILMTVFAMLRSRPWFQNMQKQVDVLNRILREQLSGIRVIRAFVRTTSEEERYERANKEMKNISVHAHWIMSALMPIVTLVINIAVVVAYYMGTIRIENGSMPIGNLIAFVTYLTQILGSIMMSSMMMNMIPRASASIHRINEVLLTEPSIPNEGQKAVFQTFESLTFDQVTFSYPGAATPVLENVSFTVKAGETVAIIGATGSGKSTLLNLIPRIYDVTQGAICINGIDIRSMSQEELRKRMGVVPQKALLFDGTVASNLQYGKLDATKDEMKHALETAQGLEFVMEMPEGLNEKISQGGSSVSGGQRQRLAIARALIRKPELLLFDDSFSALDFKTDAKLRQALREDTENAAVLIVAQRVTTVMNADCIIVLDEGKIAGMGTHQQLMENLEIYREIVRSQMNEGEVA